MNDAKTLCTIIRIMAEALSLTGELDECLLHEVTYDRLRKASAHCASSVQDDILLTTLGSDTCGFLAMSKRQRQKLFARQDAAKRAWAEYDGDFREPLNA
jgi:hypothetical protein